MDMRGKSSESLLKDYFYYKVYSYRLVAQWYDLNVTYSILLF